MCLLVLFHRLLQLDGVDLDTIQLLYIYNTGEEEREEDI